MGADPKTEIEFFFLGGGLVGSHFTSLGIFFLFFHKEKSVDGRRVNRPSTLNIVQPENNGNTVFSEVNTFIFLSITPHTPHVLRGGDSCQELAACIF